MHAIIVKEKEQKVQNKSQHGWLRALGVLWARTCIWRPVRGVSMLGCISPRFLREGKTYARGAAVPLRVSHVSVGLGVWGFLLPPAVVVGPGFDWAVDPGFSSV